jgi:hypothetical protein
MVVHDVELGLPAPQEAEELAGYRELPNKGPLAVDVHSHAA